MTEEQLRGNAIVCLSFAPFQGLAETRNPNVGVMHVRGI